MNEVDGNLSGDINIFLKPNAGGTYTDTSLQLTVTVLYAKESQPHLFMTIDRFISVKNTLA
jgi:hypothetical protein